MSILNSLGIKGKIKAPWSKYYKNGELKIEIPNGSVYDILKKNSE